eukprot:362607-Chlamydomonas_euryale.AAC.12
MTLLTSNQKPVAASDPHPFLVLAPFTERSIYRPSTPARTCHILHLHSAACGGLSAEHRQRGGDS